MTNYLVIGVYEEDFQRYADSVEAESPEQAEKIVQESIYREHVNESEETIDPDSYLLIIAGVVEVKGEKYEVVS